VVQAWRFFSAEVCRVEALSPHFVRVTFAGDELGRFADNGFDQRIKLILPLPDSGFAHLPLHEDWYASWRALPDEKRNPVRTYTVRAVRREMRQVDLDMVLHGATGPASRWAAQVSPGMPARLMGPSTTSTACTAASTRCGRSPSRPEAGAPSTPGWPARPG
jgi:NADPH-dependent ferric siderophore reductase